MSIREIECFLYCFNLLEEEEKRHSQSKLSVYKYGLQESNAGNANKIVKNGFQTIQNKLG
jgi:hypothetical protein